MIHHLVEDDIPESMIPGYLQVSRISLSRGSRYGDTVMHASWYHPPIPSCSSCVYARKYKGQYTAQHTPSRG
jgi:hypothetical protein